MPFGKIVLKHYSTKPPLRLCYQRKPQIKDLLKRRIISTLIPLVRFPEHLHPQRLLYFFLTKEMPCLVFSSFCFVDKYYDTSSIVILCVMFDKGCMLNKKCLVFKNLFLYKHCQKKIKNIFIGFDILRYKVKILFSF